MSEISELPLPEKLRLLAKWFDTEAVRRAFPHHSDSTEVQDDLVRAAEALAEAQAEVERWKERAAKRQEKHE